MSYTHENFYGNKACPINQEIEDLERRITCIECGDDMAYTNPNSRKLIDHYQGKIRNLRNQKNEQV